MKIGFYTGRFQPFHKGHLSAIQQAFKEVDFLHIGIGSSQYSHLSKNPFTAEERKIYIKDSLLEAGIPENRFRVRLIPDIHNNPEWPAHVQKLIPSFDVIFVGENGLVKKLFETYTNIPVKIIKKEVNICATDIRKMMAENGDWKKWVPPACADYLKEIDGTGRIKKIYNKK